MIIAFTLMAFQIVSCGQTGTPETDTTPGNDQTQTDSKAETTQPTAPDTSADDTTAEIPDKETGKSLIVYFSWSTSGNTERMAETIKENTGADILRIEPTVAYPTDYNECGEVAKVERDENTRPEISNLPESLDEYDTIFVGYPIWWHTAPMIIGTFLESYDLAGKDIYPFAQSASMDTEQFANSMEFVKESAKGADVHDGLFVRASDSDAIIDYLSENGFEK